MRPVATLTRGQWTSAMLIVLACLGTALGVRTKLAIDYWSAESGIALPREDGARGQKIRIAHRPQEFWMRIHGYPDRTDPQSLTADERTDLRDFLRKEDAAAHLKGWLGTWGVAQYVLCATCIVLACLGSVRPIIAKPGDIMLRVALTGLAVGLMIDAWQHAYIESLGW